MEKQRLRWLMIRRRLGRSALRLRRPLLASGRASCLGDAPEWRSMRRFAVCIIGLATRDVVQPDSAPPPLRKVEEDV